MLHGGRGRWCRKVIRRCSTRRSLPWSDWAMSACPWSSSSASRCARSASTSQRTRSTSAARGTRSVARAFRERDAAGDPRRVHQRPGRCCASADFILVAVPTPVDDAHIPDFRPLDRRQRDHRPHLEDGTTVVYESTVYPGATEEVCIPVLERDVRARVEEGLLRRLQPGAHQPGRPGAHADQGPEGGLRRHAGDAGQGRRSLRDDRRARRAPLQQHQGRRGVQGDREHAARPEHRADERAGDHLRPDRASTPPRCSRRPARSGTS